MKPYLLTTFLIITSLNVYACKLPEYQQFDFWLGDWQVSANGKVVGQNSITKSYNDCVVIENYQTPSGYKGTSLNIYDKVQKQWFQTWVDNSGMLLRLSGQLKGQDMVLSGSGKLPDGTSVIHKITWTPKSAKEVRQLWQISKDNGENWQTAFDGTYTK